MKVLSLFSGGGGLDLAIHALWPDAELVAVCEHDRAASRLLGARFPDVPNLGDITDVDWQALGPVDVIVGGFPCQDISQAGRRAGITEETRSGLWFYFRDAIRVLRPRLVLVENVSAITTGGGGLDVVLGSLAEVGFDAEWTCVRASDVGAPHRRERWFAAAWPSDTDVPRLEGREPASGHVVPAGGDTESLTTLPTPRATRGGSYTETQNLLPTPRSSDGPHGGPGQTGDGLQPAVRTMLPTPRSGSDRSSRKALTQQHWSAPSLAQAVELSQGILPREYKSWDEVQSWHGKMLPTPTAATSRGARSATSTGRATDWTIDDVAHADRWGDYAPAIARWEHVLGRAAPAPTDDQERLSPAFVEFMMGWPEGWTDLDGLSRANRLKILGNGVVPLQAEAAYRQLLSRTMEVAA